MSTALRNDIDRLFEGTTKFPIRKLNSNLVWKDRIWPQRQLTHPRTKPREICLRVFRAGTLATARSPKDLAKMADDMALAARTIIVKSSVMTHSCLRLICTLTCVSPGSLGK